MSAPAVVTSAPSGTLSVAVNGWRAVFGPDPAALAWGLSTRRLGWFGTHRYTGVPRGYAGRPRRVTADADGALAGSPATWTGGWL